MQQSDAVRLADHMASVSYRSLGASAQRAAKHLLADTVATGIAGSASPAARQLLASLLERPHGPVKCPGLSAGFQRDDAALLTGFTIHCLEWDAVHEAAVVHAMSVPTAALLADAQDRGSVRGSDLLSALVGAIDIAAGLGAATNAPLSFFRPATAGLMGAAAGVARLRGYSRKQTAHTIGLAYSQVHGTMQAHIEGTIALPLQVALSARAALTAADLAKAGLEGPHDILDGPFGYFNLIDKDSDSALFWDRLATLHAVEEVSIKPYPSGRASHGVLGALFPVIADQTISEQTFGSLVASVPPLIHRLVGRPAKPEMSPAYARLCLPYLVATALQTGEIDPTLFEGTVTPSAERLALAEKVSVIINDNPDPNALSPQSFILTHSDGPELLIEVEHTYGSPQNPLGEAETRAKLGSCFKAGAHTHDAAALETFQTGLQTVDQLEDITQIWDYFPDTLSP